MLKGALVLLSLAGSVICQDPAEGWMGYAVGTNPGNGIILHMEAKWKVGTNPSRSGGSGAFYSPWFGINAEDNLNLLQPVNPWTGSSWSIYNEYFQWSPTSNYNSKSHTVSAGDTIFGSVTYVPENSTYTIYNSNLDDGWSVTTSIPIQKKNGVPKNFTYAYVVYEKVWDCDAYPPDGQVVFYDIFIQWSGADQTTQWATDYVDDNCNMRANIINENTVSITWDTTMKGGKDVAKRGSIHHLHQNCGMVHPNSTVADCDPNDQQCEYLPGVFQCCLPGEMCVKNVGCRC